MNKRQERQDKIISFIAEKKEVSEQEFYDYQSKYLDIHEERKNSKSDVESILDQIDFEFGEKGVRYLFRS